MDFFGFDDNIMFDPMVPDPDFIEKQERRAAAREFLRCRAEARINGDVILVETEGDCGDESQDEPWHSEHLQCGNCDSTFCIRD